MVVDSCSKLRVKFWILEQVSIRICLAVFEIVRVVYGFWFLHEICRALSYDHVGTWIASKMSSYESYAQNTNRLSWKSRISYLFCHIWGSYDCFWVLVSSWSCSHLNRLHTSSYEKVMTKILRGILKWY